ncbi:MAG: kynureninase, partial [Deltaproteobacteria bacterium]|nr:kynureninase [Deltaproteobacteria bacterium]
PQETIQVVSPREGESTIRPADLLELIERDGQKIALVMLGSPNFLSGQSFDLAAITKAAHAQGCKVGFDLAHGAGNLALKLHEVGCDFAVWCNYKYLNAGPGGLGGAFVHARHANDPSLPRLAGWWGHDKTSRFEMGPAFRPIEGAEGWQLSNPPILQLAALRASMELFDEAGIDALRARGDRLTAYLEWLLSRMPQGRFSLVTPRELSQRGSMLTLRIRGDARKLETTLRAAGAVVDVRHPDIVRMTPAPLYASYEDVQRLAKLLEGALG